MNTRETVEKSVKVEQVPLEEKPKSSDSKHKTDERLDEGVEESFPASDPVSVKITKI